MALYSSGRQVQARADLFVRQADGQQPEDVQLACCHPERPQFVRNTPVVPAARDSGSGLSQNGPARRSDLVVPSAVEERECLAQPSHRISPPVRCRGLGNEPPHEMAEPPVVAQGAVALGDERGGEVAVPPATGRDAGGVAKVGGGLKCTDFSGISIPAASSAASSAGPSSCRSSASSPMAGFEV
jgi:hypothetical protein